MQVRSLGRAAMAGRRLLLHSPMSPPPQEARQVLSALPQGAPPTFGIQYEQLLPVSFQPVQLSEKVHHQEVSGLGFS